MSSYLPILAFLGISAVALAQPLPQPASGTVQRFEHFSSNFVEPRHVDVWLPAGYDPAKRYAVLYMHDGQMLYDSTVTWNRQEWGVDETLGNLMAEGKVRPCIVVGIWNNSPKRHSEYFPKKAIDALTTAQRDSLFKELRRPGQNLFGDTAILSDNYLKFIVTELKPFIDSRFSTHRNRKNTFIAGSSMGGLISLYAICEYPDVFGGAACLSTHWTGLFRVENNPLPDALLNYLQGHLPNPKNHKIYFDRGTIGLEALYSSFQTRADELMRARGYTTKRWMTNIYEGEDHSERAWKKRLQIPTVFLLGK